MKDHIKKGFGLAIGWYIGRAVYDTYNGIAAGIIRRYLPEKYWNKKHPEYIGRLKNNESSKNDDSDVKMKIGF